MKIIEIIKTTEHCGQEGGVSTLHSELWGSNPAAGRSTCGFFSEVFPHHGVPSLLPSPFFTIAILPSVTLGRSRKVYCCSPLSLGRELLFLMAFKCDVSL
jgi:hypothetical protein